MKNPKYIGTGMPRFEDRRLLTGGGRFADDIHCPEALHAAFLRSPYAHARILEIDLSRCAEAGAVAAFTGEEMLVGLSSIGALSGVLDLISPMMYQDGNGVRQQIAKIAPLSGGKLLVGLQTRFLVHRLHKGSGPVGRMQRDER